MNTVGYPIEIVEVLNGFVGNRRDLAFEQVEILSASEALYGFAGWLTSRPERTVMSSKDDAAIIADLVHEFCKVNDLSELRSGWEKVLIHPK